MIAGMGRREASEMLASGRVQSLAPIAGLALLGALFKSIAAVQGSRAALVDLLTCIANIIALAALAYVLRVSGLPPDEDHPYGHERFETAGVLWITTVYGFVAGYGVAVLLLEGVRERIPASAAIFAIIGTFFYAAAIVYARRAGLAGRAYAAFTLSEVFEGIVVAAAALAGSLFNPLVDYLAAWGLLAYLVYELYENVYHVTCILTERVPPELVRRVKARLEEKGLRVVSLRLRPILPGIYVGDAVVRVKGDSLRRVHEVVDAVEREIRSKCRVHLVIHYEPE